ncbi:MAG: GNAT family N-acetyltransferase [Bacteroidota bacterium]|nr:GNAT family N-acetyltransferase [Bacteroidota bacterium]
MIYREANTLDIEAMHVIRLAVKENVLGNPLAVTESDYINFITTKGKGWVCEFNNKILGFAIIDTESNNIWALFVDPEHERKGIGTKLHNMMLDWYFAQYSERLWLGTTPNSKAEKLYRKKGWKEIGVEKNGDLRFELTSSDRKLI